ncbi:MAG: hypothetical protein HWE27_00410 [Gammaproteobacteria bacterium]|nr:hypothetical protein [Gammaproteobacteria bacterium]
MNNVYPKSVLLTSILIGSTMLSAGELSVPNTFTAGTPARASEVNANFTAAETAVNDNNARIAALESAVSALTTQVQTLESAQQDLTISQTEYFATDLFFMQNNASGQFIIPVAEGQQSSSSIVDTNFEYHPVPGLNQVSFEVANDNTTVIIETTGEVYLTTFSAYSRASIAVAIDGAIPEFGAQQTLRMVSDDNISAGGNSWDLRVPVQLDAGTHTFTVFAKADAQNQGSLTVDGRSVSGYDGRVKASVMQIYTGN